MGRVFGAKLVRCTLLLLPFGRQAAGNILRMPVSPHTIIESFTYLHVNQYAAVAAIALVTWDYFILLPEEVALVWPARWTFSKFLFIVNRYLVFVDPVLLVYHVTQLLYSGMTRRSVPHRVLFQVITDTLIPGIVYLRAYAVWGSQYKKNFVLVLCLFLGINISSYWVLVKYLATSHQATGMTGCTFHFRNRLIWINFVTGAVLEFRIMVRDVATIVNLIVVLAGPAEMNSFLVVVERVLYSVLCSRIILNIRGYVAGAQTQVAGDFTSLKIAVPITVESHELYSIQVERHNY
ncbi:hypothetical protein BD410DRAFT_826532 [Rickenella mellea]|uniref:DUF6533 domain-containing protein n=1 Tax=Rickenella mellea TaxID=50990 RepID=A0A4Y7QED9_9AGAM|nr:hypothetical protein BD410DRAFT_826532 [Rickenella mellea]